MKLGSSRGTDTRRPRGSERSKPRHKLRLTRPSQRPYPGPPEQAQPGVSEPCRTTLDQNGNLVGVASAKLNALKPMVANNGDIAQNVNFAIKSSIVASFLEANGLSYAGGAAAQPMQPADLADEAKAISVYVECE